MADLLFMPWCRLDREYRIGKITLAPYSLGSPLKGLNATENSHVATVLGAHKGLQGKPVNRAALIRYEGKSLLEVLTDDDLREVRDLRDIACFASLAARDYFLPEPYSNSDCFTLINQRFEGDPRFAALSSRRRLGTMRTGHQLSLVSLTQPLSVSTINEIRIDHDLADALVKKRQAGSNWAKWADAIACFNQANTDNDSVRHAVEWILLASAFERFLGVQADGARLAVEFCAALVPAREIAASSAARCSPDGRSRNNSLRHEWMREFYERRGMLGHGHLTGGRSAEWNEWEHLGAATIALPLAVKSVLSESSFYTLTDDDSDQIDAFESLIAEHFLTPPPGQESSIDVWWSRLRSTARLSRAVAEAARESTP
jgi:hypothetical protein